MRVFGCQAHTRNESERRWEPPRGAPSTDPDVLGLLSTRGTAGSDIWFMCLADKPMVRSYHLRDYD